MYPLSVSGFLSKSQPAAWREPFYEKLDSMVRVESEDKSALGKRVVPKLLHTFGQNFFNLATNFVWIVRVCDQNWEDENPIETCFFVFSLIAKQIYENTMTANVNPENTWISWAMSDLTSTKWGKIKVSDLVAFTSTLIDDDY